MSLLTNVSEMPLQNARVTGFDDTWKMNKTSVKLCLVTMWLAFVSLGISIMALYCWHRYAMIHWHGPQKDWIGLICGEDMFRYLAASHWIAFSAVVLAAVQVVRCRREKLICYVASKRWLICTANYLTLLACLWTFVATLAVT